jgi:hypothetical protein
MPRFLMTLLVAGLLLGAAHSDESVDDKLRRAFPGDDNPIRAPIKFVSKTDRLIIAASAFEFLSDGRIRAKECYIVRLPAEADSTAQSTTARSGMALISFDKPVRSMKELSGRKIHSAEFDAGVRMEFSAR